MSNPKDYTVGWICAIVTEYVAAQTFLDERHDGPECVSPNDNNDYTLGRIGKHNVAIAVLPDGEYGISSAAAVARDMLHSFPNVRIGLMVGIGGGAPGRKHDIRLGDVVVSAPRDGKGGVFQYDFGTTIQDQSFRTTGFLSQPPTILRTALSGLKAQYESDGHQLVGTINSILDKKPRLRKKYAQPNPNTDRLYRSGVVHPLDNDSACTIVCGDDPINLVLRSERTEEDDNPRIHYGLIASANQLMKDALVRDALTAENEEVLCFEMEAAGLMNHFPCLVIRGICDYSDSHKNKEWQGYAAMTAAAYAKDILHRIPPNKVEAEKRISGILSGFQKVAEEHRDIARKQLNIQEDAVKQKWSDKQEDCLRLFRLTDGIKDATYEWYKGRVEDRVRGTCTWFLEHTHFQKWLEQESGLLLVSADPGCGKSVLAKYLIDHELPQSATVCYFFFKDQDQNTVCQALCAVLHQLFSQKPSLIEYAMEEFAKDGSGLVNSTNSLWTVLRNAVQDPQAGPVIVVLDALDECAEPGFEDLIRNVESQFRSSQSGRKLKYLLTSRPYEQIVCRFRGLLDAFPYIRIPGEEESESISQEVNSVIQYRVKQLAKEKGLSDPVKDHLAEKLLDIPHRTYLWVYLMFDYLRKEDFKKTPRGIDSTIAELPKNIDQAYEHILRKSKEHPIVRKALSIILAAARPLSLSEMNVALSIDETSKSFHDLDLEEDADFKLRLRSWCGLFVSIHHGKIYFLHQTAREFLLADLPSPATVSSGLHWHRSITVHHAHTVLAEACVLYLNLFNTDNPLPDTNEKAGRYTDNHVFLEYSASNWGLHFREARIDDNAFIVPHATRICDPDSKSYSAWFRIYWKTINYMRIPKYFSGLMVASYFGHDAVVRLLLDKGADIDKKDDSGRTALWYAAQRGYKGVVRQLLDNGADTETKNKDYGLTPLSSAARSGHEVVVWQLLDRGADIDARDDSGRTPLSYAAEKGHGAVVQQLLDKGADVKIGSNLDRTPLSYAAERGHKAVAQQLLNNGADVEAIDDYDGKPILSWAAENGHEAIVRLLLDKGADIETKSAGLFFPGRTPLSYAIERGHETVVRQLLDRGADIDTRDDLGGTPLAYAAARGYNGIVGQLLDKGADVEAKDDYGQTPLWYAAWAGHKEVVQQLLDKGADVNARSNLGRTPLLIAALEGREGVVQQLLDNGANIEARCGSARTPLLYAVGNGHEAVAQHLLNKGADGDARDDEGFTPLLFAAENGYAAVVQQLLDKGSDVETKDTNSGRTLLSWAAENGHVAVVQQLLDNGADAEAKDTNHGRTPLSYATENGHYAVVQLLQIHVNSIHAATLPYGKHTYTELSTDSDYVIINRAGKGELSPG